MLVLALVCPMVSMLAYVDIDVYYTDVDADNGVFVLKSKGH